MTNINIKTIFRKIIARMPLGVRILLTKIKIAERTNYLMSEEEIVLGESNSLKRDELVEKYKKKYPRQAKMIAIQIENSFPAYVKYKNLSSSDRIEMIHDAEFCWFAYGFIIYEYVFLDFAGINNTPEKRRTFVSDAERIVFRFCANDFTDTSYADKIRAYEILNQFYKREMLIVRNKSDYDAFMDFVKRHPNFVLKESTGSRGNGVKLVNTSTLQVEIAFKAIIKRGGALLEEVIEQSEKFASFNSASVNTVRLFTFNTRHGVIVPFGFFRTGRKGSFVDNCAAGGVFATIDTKRGVLTSKGCTEFGERFDSHPDSGIVMYGFQLPDWDEAIRLCKKMALIRPNLKYLAWDLAYSNKNGWDLVEVNTSGQLMMQAGNLLGIKHEMSKIIQDMDLLIPFDMKL